MMQSSAPLLAWLVNSYVLGVIIFGIAALISLLLRQPIARVMLARASLALVAISMLILWFRPSLETLPANWLARQAPSATSFDPQVTAKTVPSNQDRAHRDDPTATLVRAEVTTKPSDANATAPALPSTRSPSVVGNQVTQASDRNVDHSQTGQPADQLLSNIVGMLAKLRDSLGNRLPFIAMFMSGSAIAAGIWLLIGSIRQRYLLSRVQRADPSLQATCQATFCELLTQRVGTSLMVLKAPIVFHSNDLRGAALVDWLRPKILLPNDLQQSPQSITHSAIRHECAHLVRRDLHWQWLTRVLLPMQILNPFYWLMRRQIQRDQEFLADSIASADNPIEYAESLLHFARQLPARQPYWQLGLGMAEQPILIERRIAMIVNETNRVAVRSTLRMRVGAALVVCLSLAALVSIPKLNATSFAPQEQPTKVKTSDEKTPETKAPAKVATRSQGSGEANVKLTLVSPKLSDVLVHWNGQNNTAELRSKDQKTPVAIRLLMTTEPIRYDLLAAKVSIKFKGSEGEKIILNANGEMPAKIETLNAEDATLQILKSGSPHEQIVAKAIRLSVTQALPELSVVAGEMVRYSEKLSLLNDPNASDPNQLVGTLRTENVMLKEQLEFLKEELRRAKAAQPGGSAPSNRPSAPQYSIAIPLGHLTFADFVKWGAIAKQEKIAIREGKTANELVVLADADVAFKDLQDLIKKIQLTVAEEKANMQEKQFLRDQELAQEKQKRNQLQRQPQRRLLEIDIQSAELALRRKETSLQQIIKEIQKGVLQQSMAENAQFDVEEAKLQLLRAKTKLEEFDAEPVPLTR